jgi:hypothetical protein
MKPLRQLKKTTSLLTIALLLALGLMPRAKAVVPPPDGGYPGFNTAEGQMRFSVLLPVLAILRSVGFRSGATRLATSTRQLAPGAFLLTAQMKIPLLALERF